uniref:Uncharacterized protein n=1 Tax=Timema shepardi TaxID=629360 RepID=A0A7R9B6R4_TIMSH|nr:unnamed protein product [Timema shepardi]
MCWYANEIAVESSEVGMAAYKCPWYDASPKFKFRIQNIMRRSQKPAAITAGMFGALSMWAFTGSSEVGMAAYKCPWYDSSPKFKFRIQNIMRRSQKPAAITAGMFGALSMWAFTGVLQTSYSYFAVLRQSNTR